MYTLFWPVDVEGFMYTVQNLDNPGANNFIFLFVLRFSVVGLILGLRPANKSRCYFVRTFLIAWI